MLEFDGVEPGELDGDRGRPGDAGRRVVVGDVHLLDVAARDHVALRRSPVTGDEHATGELQCDDRGAVRHRVRRAGDAIGRGSAARGEQVRRLTAQHLREGRSVHRGGSGDRRVEGQLFAIRPGHCPPFWTYARTKSSAFSSRTSSISSSRSSVSSASFSRRSWPAAVVPVGRRHRRRHRHAWSAPEPSLPPARHQRTHSPPVITTLPFEAPNCLGSPAASVRQLFHEFRGAVH